MDLLTLTSLLFLLPSLRGQTAPYTRDYKGFNSCGVQGWSCTYTNAGYEVSYHCDASGDQNARIWAWTARIPSKATILTIRDCNHVEVHFDCTKGVRSYDMLQFRAINITKLDFLRPIRPGIFLHDNDQIAQSPPGVYLENIESTNFYNGLFKNPAGLCRYRNKQLRRLELKNVRIERITSYSLNNQTMDSLIWQNVTVGEWETGAFNVTFTNSIAVSTSQIGSLSEGAIVVKAPEVRFNGNVISGIDPQGLVVGAKNFKFTDNKVGVLNSKGLNIIATNTEITNNWWTQLSTEAFADIKPGLGPSADYSEARHLELVYNFSNNNIDSMDLTALHVDWLAYKNTCSVLFLKNNTIKKCTSFNVTKLGAGESTESESKSKLTMNEGFYNLFYEASMNNTDIKHCSVNTIDRDMEDNCNRTSQQCSSTLDSTTDITNELTEEVEKHREEAETTRATLAHDSHEEESQNINTLHTTYHTENQKAVKTTSSTSLIIGVIVTAVILSITVMAGVVFIFYRKKRKTEMTTVYTNYKNSAEADAVMLVHE